MSLGLGRAIRVVGTAGTFTHGDSNGGARLHRIVVTKFAASAVVTVYDGTSASGTVVAVIDASALPAQGSYEFAAFLRNGLHVTVTGGAAEVTVVYS